MHTSWPTNGVHTPRTQLAYITHTEEACAWDHAIGCIDETKTSRPSTGAALQLERRAAARAGLTPRCRWRTRKRDDTRNHSVYGQDSHPPQRIQQGSFSNNLPACSSAVTDVGMCSTTSSALTAIRCMHQNTAPTNLPGTLYTHDPHPAQKLCSRRAQAVWTCISLAKM